MKEQEILDFFFAEESSLLHFKLETRCSTKQGQEGQRERSIRKSIVHQALILVLVIPCMMLREGVLSCGFFCVVWPALP
jgi:hypothetical protein